MENSSKYNFDLLRPENTVNSHKLMQEEPWVEKSDIEHIEQTTSNQVSQDIDKNSNDQQKEAVDNQHKDTEDQKIQQDLEQQKQLHVTPQEEQKISLNDLLVDHKSKMTQIFNNQVLTVTANQGEMQYFYFDVEKPSVIIIKAWPANDDSDPDIYLSNTTPFVSTGQYQWKSANIGSDRIDVHPQDLKYKLGRYYIGANPYRVGLNTFYVSLALIEASKFYNYQNYKCISQDSITNQICIEQVHMLVDGVEQIHTVEDSTFFQYNIKHMGSSYLYLHVQCLDSPLTIEKTELYVSTLNIYPNEKEHKWAFGDLPQSVIDKAKFNPFMRDITTEASPFEIEQDKIVYYRGFKNRDKFKPQMLTEEDFDNIQNQNNSNNNIRSHQLQSVSILPEDEENKEQKNDIRVLLESEAWRFVSHKGYIGLYNRLPQNRTYKIQLTEMMEDDVLPHELREKYLFFKTLFKSEDEAAQISQKERQRINVCDKTEFTYGEVIFPYFLPLLELTNPQPGEIFYDLGCGGGRPLFIASLGFPQLKKCVGIEYLQGLFDLATQTSKDYMSTAQDKFPNENIVPVEILQGDMLQLDWSDADIIYASSICFPDELVEGIVDLCVKLKKGSRVLTLKSLPEREYMKLEYSLKIKMSWGRCQVLMYTKITEPGVTSVKNS